MRRPIFGSMDYNWAFITSVTSAVSAAAAAAGLWYLARATKSQARAVDAQTALRLIDDLAVHWKHIATAADAGEEAKRAAIIDWMNHTEAVASLYMKDALEPVSRALTKPQLISFAVSVRMTPALAAIRQEATLDESTFEFIRAFERRHRAEINLRLPEDIDALNETPTGG